MKAFTLQCSFFQERHPVLATPARDFCVSSSLYWRQRAIVDSAVCFVAEIDFQQYPTMPALVVVLNVFWSLLPWWHAPIPFQSSRMYLTTEWAVLFREQKENNQFCCYRGRAGETAVLFWHSLAQNATRESQEAQGLDLPSHSTTLWAIYPHCFVLSTECYQCSHEISTLGEEKLVWLVFFHFWQL